ncbi:putative repeat protein (TIGR01451 family) [Salirhabdus euzebyi]|uniref:Putative repeat protein (TIGR01451 family) n=1 Tax=Salirhabdus euzebyi TaxID=394506 RepID=A0A841Q4I4_9BACI|nr:DUF11 domain-containing protein [Salirhabdus euzebyi]MBB6453339.1 putative repeat protein (TIGR01451 family) [Salirhabdus euzebyi]
MVDVCNSCECVPYQNICACPPIQGISVVQPQCQTLPTGTISQNPCFDEEADVSYWTYKFLTDSTPGQLVSGISNFVIPICETITEEDINVLEKIDGCGEFTEVAFTLDDTDPNFGPAPEGFNWLKVETDDRYDKGVCVEYRLEIEGNFPACAQPIGVKAGPNDFFFDCEDCYLVPCCGAAELTVDKTCELEGNVATFKVSVCNTGDTTLENIELLDVVTFPENLPYTEITVSPNQLEVDEMDGLIEFFGNIGSLEPGECTNREIQITFAPTEPGEYAIENTATAEAEDGTLGTDTCDLVLAVVQVSGDKCCIVNGNNIQFVLSVTNQPDSPATNVTLFDTICIPEGLTVEFDSFGTDCTAFISETDTPVETGEELEGPLCIDIVCETELPADGEVEKVIELTIVQSTTFGPTPITNVLSDIFITEDDQVELEPINIPAEADATFTAMVECDTPCENGNGTVESTESTRNGAENGPNAIASIRQFLRANRNNNN